MVRFGMIESIVYLAGNLFRMYIISCFFKVFFNTDVPRKRKVVRLLCYALYFGANSAGFLYFNWPSQIIILTNVIGSLILAGTYNGTWKYRICAVAVTVATNIVCEDFVYYTLIIVGIEHIVIIGIIAANLMFLMIVLLLQRIVDLKKGMDISASEWISVVLIPVCSLLVSAIALDNCRNEIAVATGGISMILVNVFLFFLLDRIQAMYRSQLDLNLLEQQNQAYENQMLLSKSSEEQITALRHDMKNHFFALEQLAREDNSIEIQRYLDSLLPEIEMSKKLVSTGNPIIDSFLNMKLSKAIEYGAEVKVDISISKELFIASKDISIIFGNLLDNALRALERCEYKRVLRITIKEEPGKLFIHIENSYSEFIRKVGKIFVTTKADKLGHGIGLKNVQRVVDTYHGQMIISHTDETFSVKLLLFAQ